ncbi:MAG: hypothetical protein WD063_03325 [Pirellulales bacterium]
MRLLRRFLRRLCAARFVVRFVAADRPGEMFVGGHQVVLHGDVGRVTQPTRHYLDRVILRKLCLAASPQVVEEPGPGLESGATDDFRHHSSSGKQKSPMSL